MPDRAYCSGYENLFGNLVTDLSRTPFLPQVCAASYSKNLKGLILKILKICSREAGVEPC